MDDRPNEVIAKVDSMDIIDQRDVYDAHIHRP